MANDNDETLKSQDGYVCMKFPTFSGENESHYTFDELQAIEKRRRIILRRSEAPFWRILAFWDGTCLKPLVKDGLLWTTLGIYAFARWFTFRGESSSVEYLSGFEDTNIDIIGGFLSFFLVLFVNQSNSRFNTMYSQSMQAIDHIHEVASIASCYVPKPNAQRLIRYLNAAHAAAYVGLSSDTYSTGEFFVQLNNKHKFLTETEMKRTTEIGMDTGADCMRELLIWAIRDVQVLQEQKTIEPRMSSEMRDKIQKFRGAIMTLYNHKDQQIHFFYIHLIAVLTAFYLPLFAVETAVGVGTGEDGNVSWTTEVLSAMIVFVQAVFVIGLRLLGNVMMDPYGDDVEDLSVLYYVQHAWEASNRILATRFPADLDPQLEEGMYQTRAGLGRAWDDDSSLPSTPSTSRVLA